MIRITSGLSVLFLWSVHWYHAAFVVEALWYILIPNGASFFLVISLCFIFLILSRLQAHMDLELEDPETVSPKLY